LPAIILNVDLVKDYISKELYDAVNDETVYSDALLAASEKIRMVPYSVINGKSGVLLSILPKKIYLVDKRKRIEVKAVIALTPSKNESDDLAIINAEISTNTNGFGGNEAILFQAPPASTSLAVRRFSKNAGEYMFTASNVEKNVLLQNGWLDEGIAWYVDQKTPQIYRFKINERYFYTGSLSEAAAISNKLGAYEGIAFGTNQESATPVFRLNSYQSHFFTANITEFLHSVNNGWNYEGIGWYLNNTAGANKPVYRLRGDYYFYTASEYEKNFLISKGWALEGVAWYVPQSSTAPVYRVNGDYHFYTASSAERDYLVARGWRSEGAAW
jgi:hypothetical protein